MIRQIHVFKTRGEYLAWKSINILAATTLAYIISEDIFIGKLLDAIKNNTFSSGVVKFSISANTLSITAPTGYSVYYTTDGSTPTAESTAYSDPISLASIDSNTTIKMVGIKNNKASKVVEVTIVKPATPTLSVATDNSNKVSFASTTAGSTFYYTTNSDAPSTSSSSGTSVTINSSCTLKVIAVKDGIYSAVKSQVYTVPATPVITTSATGATITCATTGATIYYTTNGSTPTASSSVYSSALTGLADGTIVKAIAIKDNFKSAMAQGKVEVPVFTKIVCLDTKNFTTIKGIAAADYLAMCNGTYSGEITYETVDIPVTGVEQTLNAGTHGAMVAITTGSAIKNWHNTEALQTDFVLNYVPDETAYVTGDFSGTGYESTKDKFIIDGVTYNIGFCYDTEEQTMKIVATKNS